jgi:hypothetical protein
LGWKRVWPAGNFSPAAVPLYNRHNHHFVTWSAGCGFANLGGASQGVDYGGRDQPARWAVEVVFQASGRTSPGKAHDPAVEMKKGLALKAKTA